MQRYNRLPYSPGATFRCVRSFVMSGTAYSMGDVVDTSGIEDRRLRQMYDARMIEPLPEGTPAPKKPAAPVATKAPQPVAEQAQASEGTPLSVEHRGFGRWYVMRGTETVSGPHTQAEAQRMAAA